MIVNAITYFLFFWTFTQNFCNQNHNPPPLFHSSLYCSLLCVDILFPLFYHLVFFLMPPPPKKVPKVCVRAPCRDDESPPTPPTPTFSIAKTVDSQSLCGLRCVQLLTLYAPCRAPFQNNFLFC